MLSNTLVWWWVGLCSLWVSCLAWGDPALESTGFMVGFMVTSKRAHLPRDTSQDCCRQSHCPHSKSLLTPTSTGDPPTSRCLVQYIVGSLLLSLVSWYTQDFFCALYASPSPVEVLQTNPTGFLSQIPWGFLVTLLDPQTGKPDRGLRTFIIGKELLRYYCSPICGSPTWWVWDFILFWLCQSYCVVVASPLSLDLGYCFLVGSSVHLLMVVQQLVLISWFHGRRWPHVLLLHHLDLIF